MSRCLRPWAPTYQLVGLLERPLRPADGGFARLAGRLFDLLYLLRQVGLHELQLCLIAAKALGAGLCVDEVGHGYRGYESVWELRATRDMYAVQDWWQ